MSDDILQRAAELAAQLREMATDDGPAPGGATARGAAYDLVVEIDTLVRELYRHREELSGAARVFDNATNRRVDRLLGKRDGDQR